ncbi:MAG TPA: hypothetical protein VFR58_13785, partial [Flavisolibacter sp.]|nr:hypothetical protein [Flavisolibacter sp.]
HKAVVQGEAFGVIRGSRFLRDGAGNRIIGADGFPLADPVKGVIGNPIPDFVVKMNNSTSWKMFTLNLDWEWKKGGDVWNGTQAVLDYYGRSENSARLRGTTGYVFEGVRQDGHPNTQPVRFYDEGRPVTDNRWTRYGHGGIAEEYIEKGDHLRLNNIGLSCKLKMKKYLKSMTLTAYVHNLMIWTAYDGADPDRLLQDQPGTQGLDFFNIPTAKTFGFNMSIQF